MVARAQISGKQIKDESLTTDDIKDGSIYLVDLNQEVLDAITIGGDLVSDDANNALTMGSDNKLLVDTTQINVSGSLDPQEVDLLIGNGYGWNDLIGTLEPSGTGNNNPNWGVFRGGIYAYMFESGKMNEVWSNFHIGHDYALGTKVYPHIHWAPTTTHTGTVRWGFEYTMAKGHEQTTGSVFVEPVTSYVEYDITSAKQYMHIVSEIAENDGIDSALIEPDTIIAIRIFRDANHPNDTYPADVAGLCADMHYQMSRLSTKNRTPNFYV